MIKLIKYLFTIVILFLQFFAIAQQQKSLTSSEIINEIQKLKVCGSVLYIAAHPDDENTRLLTYLVNERKLRTGYLSLTRGDGGQNLIGNEQGVELGLIRTQELLAARKIDGAEQFFTSAYDFGYSKTSDETFTIWDKEKILSDVVWVIRKFKPDVIITRFPEDSRAGHGHHSASAILAKEAFFAAADRNKFPEQLQNGVNIWQAKRIVWNTFNFGGNNTTNENQLKIDVGGYNTLLGKSYGEIAALSRSQHKSQGFGVPSQRGSQLEYFTLVAGEPMFEDIMDSIDIGWDRFAKDEQSLNRLASLRMEIRSCLKQFEPNYPENSLSSLIKIHKIINDQSYSNNKDYKLQQLNNIIANCIGLYMESTTGTAYGVQGDSLKLNFIVNSRLKDSVLLKNIFYKSKKFDANFYLQKNKNWALSKSIFINNDEPVTQPYWLVNEMTKGSFNIKEQTKIGNANVDYENAQFVFEINGELLIYNLPIQYKFTDPVKGEIFHPMYIIPAIDLFVKPNVVVNTPNHNNNYSTYIKAQKDFDINSYTGIGDTKICDTIYRDFYFKDILKKNATKSFVVNSHTFSKPACGNGLQYSIVSNDKSVFENKHLKTIQYDHIPTINYLQNANIKFVNENIITNPKTIGYINGAGDKVVDALTQLGYKVDILNAQDIVLDNLKKYDAIITGVRAYNTNEWLNSVYETLIQFVNNGGNLIVQYNTSSSIGPIKSKIAPYDFTISKNRITNENAKVNFVNTNDIVLNFPNKIIQNDFNNWVQERSVNEATELDSHYRTIFTMNDENENPTNGSLIIANYGKGNFVYSSLALFRQLPAGVSGAYKLLANIIELPKNNK